MAIIISINNSDSGLIARTKINDNDSAINVQSNNHIADIANPHIVTAAQVGLSNANNTSDLDKPISTATQTALDDKVNENVAITPGTHTKISFDAKGLITGGFSATTADINDSTDRRYVTDAESVVIANASGVNTGDQTITLTGQASGSGNGSFAVTLDNDSVIAKTLTAFSSNPGTVSAADSILAAIQKIDGNVNALNNAIVLQGTWDASVGTFPGVGTAQSGYLYIVSVGGTVDSVSFNVGDRLTAITDNASTTTFSGNWFKEDYTDQVSSVFGRVGAIVSANGDYTASQITNVPSGTISAINTQAAIDELESEKQHNLINGVDLLATAEVNQLANIGAETISTTQWGYLGATNQGISTTDSPTFSQITGTLQTPAQTNITSLGTLTVLTINSSTVTLSQDTNFVTSGGVNGMSIDGTTFSVDGTNHRIGIGTATPLGPLDMGTATGRKLLVMTYGAANDHQYEGIGRETSKLIYQVSGPTVNHVWRSGNGALASIDLMQLFGDGGLTLGAATGGNKGAGTINTTGDIYKNNSAYTNPDYVLEMWATGKIEKFKKNDGAKGYTLPTLDEIETNMREKFQLPRMTNNSMGSFARQDWILEKMEEAFICIIDLKNQIKTLKEN